MAAERIVAGGTIAALVSADALAAAGRRVRLMLPERGVGAGFVPLRRDAHTLELGVRLLELGYEDDAGPVPPLDDYVAGLGGHRPYTRLVRGWVRELLGDRLVEVPRPSMVLDGRRVDDILFTVDLTALPAALDDGERERMAREVEAALAATGSDAGVLDRRYAADFATMTLERASLANHGRRFHERIVAPLCEKVLAGGCGVVLAPLRRKAWAPLFHPRTLLEALRGAVPAFRPARSFHTVAPGGCGGLVSALMERLDASPLVTLETAGTLTCVAREPGGARLRFSGGDGLVASRPVVATSPGELFAAAGIPYAPRQVRTAIAWLEAGEADARHIGALVHVLDPANPVLRVSTGGAAPAPGRRVLCVELRHDADEAGLAEAARRGLEDAGLLVKTADVLPITQMARPTFPVPSPATRTAHVAARAALRARRLDCEVLGGGLDLGADSLNEQIVQGLRTGALAA